MSLTSHSLTDENCFEHGISYSAGPGSILSTESNVNSAQDCLDLCKANDDCTHAVWNMNNDECKLKDKFPSSESQYNTNPQRITVNKFCG